MWAVAFSGVVLVYPEKEESQSVLLRSNPSVYYQAGSEYPHGVRNSHLI